MEPPKLNNQVLREIVASTGLSEPVALTIFNRGLGIAGLGIDAWKGLLAAPESPQFRPLEDKMLEHAKKVFEKLTRPG